MSDEWDSMLAAESVSTDNASDDEWDSMLAAESVPMVGDNACDADEWDSMLAAESVPAEPEVVVARLQPKRRGRPSLDSLRISRSISAVVDAGGEKRHSIADARAAKAAKVESRLVLRQNAGASFADWRKNYGIIDDSVGPLALSTKVEQSLVAFTKCLDVQSHKSGAPQIEKLITSLVSRSDHVLSSTKSLSQRCGISDNRTTLRNTLRLAQCALLHNRHCQRELENSILSNDGFELLHYFEFDMYDGATIKARIAEPTRHTGSATAMRDQSGMELVAISDVQSHASPSSAIQPPAAGMQESAIVPSASQPNHWIIASRGLTKINKVKKESGQIKLFQTQTSWGMLLPSKPHGDQRAEYFFLVGSNINFLQWADRETGETWRYSKEMQATLNVPFAERFLQRTRVVSRDLGSCNTKCERGIADDRGSWSSFEVACQMHRAATITKHTMCLVQDWSAAHNSLSQSLRNSGDMARFRNVMRRVVRRRIKILVGSPPRDAVLYRMMCLRMFYVGKGSKQIERLIALNKFPNGDWRNRNSVEVSAGPPLRPRLR